MTFDPGVVEIPGDHDACGVGFVADRYGRASHALLACGLEALARLTHRGGAGDGVGTADGCGVLTAIPWSLIERDLPAARAGETRTRAAAMLFVPRGAAHAARTIIEIALAGEGWRDAWWRPVPVDESRLGPAERAQRPDIWQLVVWSDRRGAPADWSLYRARLDAAGRLQQAGADAATLASLSTRTIVYKALVDPVDLLRFFPDLADPRFTAPFVVFHQRFSTNTFPDWSMAQPFHLLAHNGEINTIVASLVIGVLASGASHVALHWKTSSTLDDTLDVFPCHGVGGMAGMMLTAVFASEGGLITGSTALFFKHLAALGLVAAFTFTSSWLLYRLTNVLRPPRVDEQHEQLGLDLSQHGESVAVPAAAAALATTALATAK